MKKIVTTILLLCATVGFAGIYQGQTNAPSAEVNSSFLMGETKTNINLAIIEVLQGTKTVSKDLYGASKAAVSQAIDFAKEQTPLVVEEYLKLCVINALARFTGWALIAGLLFYAGRRIYKYSAAPSRSESDREIATVLKWIVCVIGLFIMVINLSNIFEIVRIKVAPRVYLINAVVDKIQDQTPRYQR